MKPILCSTNEVKAILDGRKTQTRRVIKFNDNFALVDNNKQLYYDGETYPISTLLTFSKYQIGETIWVREPVKVDKWEYNANKDEIRVFFFYRSDNIGNSMIVPKKFHDSKWLINCQGIPNRCVKEMARIFLKVTNVRVEKLRVISYEDIVAEGFNVTLHDGTKGQLKKEAFKWWINLWNKTAPKGHKWEDNPYVFVYDFERVETTS